MIAIWPDGKKTVRTNIAADTTLVLTQSDGFNYGPSEQTNDHCYLFTDITSTSGIQYRHTEYEFNDFAYQRLLPQKFSQLGPFITSGDINGDGSIDFFVGGAANFSGKLFTQNRSKLFNSKNLIDSMESLERTWIVFCSMLIMTKTLICWLPMGMHNHDNSSDFPAQTFHQ